MVGFAAASALGGAATGFGMLLAGRAIQGAFGAMLAPAALSTLTVTFTNPAERGKAFGIYGAIAGPAGPSGCCCGGILTPVPVLALVPVRQERRLRGDRGHGRGAAAAQPAP